MDPQLTLTVHSAGHSVTLSVGGEVDLATAPQLEAKLVDLVDAEGAGSIVVDLTAVGFLDSTGITVLLTGQHRAQARGRTIRLVCPEGPVLRVVRLTGVERALPVYGSLAEAAQDAESMGAQGADAG